MSLIDFPDIPDLPGVPAIARLPNTATGAIGAALAMALAKQSIPESPDPWQITDPYGNPLLVPDSVIDFMYRGEMRIPNYPMEQGSFASYNKVYVPFDVHMTVACNGRGSMTRSEFLKAIEALRSNVATSLNPVWIVTPDGVYKPCNLVHADYRREARNGVSLVLAKLWFQEIRIAGQPQASPSQPSGSSPVRVGQVAPVAPSVQQSGAFSSLASAAGSLMNSASTFWQNVSASL